MNLKRLRRALIVISWLTAVLCVILLLNFTAPNPTGRRYSSQMPVTTGQGTSQEIGRSGELILAKDLGGLPLNDSPDQRQCFCNNVKPAYTPNLNECRTCMAYAQLESSFRRPDFVAPTFIAESKNAANLLYENRDFAQIGDFAIASRALGRPLWVFIRVNTNIDSEFYRIVRATGGDIVPYFTVPGYVDPVDSAAGFVLAIVLVLFVVMGAWEAAAYSWSSRPVRAPAAPQPVQTTDTPKSKTQPENNALRRAMRGAEATESFFKQSEESARSDMDESDAHHDEP